MTKSMILAAALALSGALASAQPKNDIGYDAHANAFEQLDAAVAKADAEDKLLLVISGGDWCKWCHYLAAFLDRETALDAALHAVFVVQKVYVGDENMNKEFFARLPKAAGAPHFWVLSQKGDLLASQDTLPLEDGAKSYDRAKFAAFIERWRNGSAPR
ncbi:MAG TPA: thioredoxin family protein [Gammaproteobacteria bacterium]